MKLILNNEIELDVLSSTEIKELNDNSWTLTIEARGDITSQQVDNFIQNNILNAVLKDENQEEKDLSIYQIVGNIRILYGNLFNENVIRIKLQNKGE